MSRKKTFDCNNPGYCCSYPFIEISKTDLKRLAKHFDLEPVVAEKRFTYYSKEEKALGLRKQKDPVFGIRSSSRASAPWQWEGRPTIGC